MHISYGGANFCGSAQGHGITREVFKFTGIKIHGGDELGESAEAGSEVKVIIHPGEVRGAQCSDAGGFKW